MADLQRLADLGSVLCTRQLWPKSSVATRDCRHLLEKCCSNDYLNFDLLRNFQSIIDFDPEIPHRAF